MTIYLDYIFIENLLIDYILLKETSYVARKNTLNKYLLLSAIVGTSYVVLMLYLKLQQLNYLICKALLIIVMVYIAFRPKKVYEYIKLTGVFILISVINVGTITVLTNLLNLERITGLLKVTIYSASLLLSRFFTRYMWKVYKQNIKDHDLIYKVKIRINDKTYKYKGFLDTGNNVFSYTYDVPVIFAELIDDEILYELKEKESFSIKTVTLSSAQEKRAYIFDNVEITKEDKTYKVKVAIVFEKTKLSKDNSYNMLLNYNLYTQDLGGIKIWI